MSLLFMLTISFPEAMLLSYLAIQFIGKKPVISEVVLVGLVQMVIAYIVRSFPIPVGMHSILLMCSTILIIFMITRIPLWSITTGYIVIFVIYFVVEITTTQLFLMITGMTIQGIIHHPYMRIVLFAPAAFLMLAIIIIFKKYSITFSRVAKWEVIIEDLKDETKVDSHVLLKQFVPAVVLILLPVLILYILNFTYVSVRIEDYSGQYSKWIKTMINSLISLWGLFSMWAITRINRSIIKEHEAKRNAQIIEQLEQMARTDELTGLLNRRSLMEQLDIEIKRSQRYQRSLSMVIFDLDKFKEINDSYGHVMGDRVLKEVSKVISKNTRSIDIVGRYGGDEFIVIMPDTDLESARQIGVRIQDALQNTCLMEGENVLQPLAISLGVGEIKEFHQEGDPAQHLLKMADDDLYQAKELAG